MVGLFLPLDLELNLSPGALTPPLWRLLVASCSGAHAFKMVADQFLGCLGTRVGVSHAPRCTESAGASCLAARVRNRQLSPDEPGVEGSAVEPEIGRTLQSPRSRSNTRWKRGSSRDTRHGAVSSWETPGVNGNLRSRPYLCWRGGRSTGAGPVEESRVRCGDGRTVI